MESETQTDELEVDQPVPIDKTVESEFQDDQGLYERQLDDILLKLKKNLFMFIYFTFYLDRRF
jgi:hypothetical protein